MTITFLTDGNNDLFLANGRLATATGVDAVAQCCTNAVKTLLGECVLDTERGMPNFKLIWGGSPNLKLYESALRKTLLAVDGVDQVVSVDISSKDGVLAYTATIATIYGARVINGSL